MKPSILSVVYLTIWCVSLRNVYSQISTVKDDTTEVSQGLSTFAIEMLTKTAIEGGDQINIIMATYSIWNLLAILNEGAIGATSDQLRAALRLPNNNNIFRVGYKAIGSALTSKTAGVEVNTASAIFTNRNKQIQKDTQAVIGSQYKVDIFPVNFQDARNTAQMIDNFIAKATNDRIKHFINYEDLNNAELLLTTAIFFKGQWTTPFNLTGSMGEPFYDENKRQIGTVNMMYQSSKFAYRQFDDLQITAVELPYGQNERYSMIVILPYEGIKLTTALQRLSTTPFQNIIDALEQDKEENENEPTEVYLPKFKFSSDFVLNVVLEKMGILDVFDPAYANLKKLSLDDLYLSRVIHKAEIEVNERGTIASGATGADLQYKIPSPKFRANRPFAFFIVEKSTGTMLFAGKISNPQNI